MRDSTGALWKLLRTGKPLACVLYEDFAAREALVELSYLIAPNEFELRRTEELEESLDPGQRNAVVLFVPHNEIEAIRGLDARRAQLAQRTAPMVLFLLRRGSGVQELAVRRGLAALLRDQEVDPDEIDRAAIDLERARFCSELRQTPEEWLEAWRAGQKADTPANNLVLHQALLLERGRRVEPVEAAAFSRR
ncbi:MAG: hypothetical protein ABI134_15380 [Byssovorax sp.]